MKVLGLDPGTTATGWGVVVFAGGRLTLDSCGVWRPKASLPLGGRLVFLFERAVALLGQCRPDAVSIETVFSGKHAASAVKLAHARGALLLAAARGGYPTFEYEPRLVKKALVGYGQAEKTQVRAMVLSLLARQRARVPLDAADALALAVCHIHAAPAGVTGRQ